MTSSVADTFEAAEAKWTEPESRFQCCKALTHVSEEIKRSGGGGGDRDCGSQNAAAILKSFKDGALRKGFDQLKEVSVPADICVICDKAVETVISSVVANAARHVSIKAGSSKATALDTEWASAESPARVDLAGAWTDTPPICTDYGGDVVGAAVKVDGKNPIGCRLRRTSDLKFVICERNAGGEKSTFVYHSPDELRNYGDPSVDAALIKACICYAGLDTLNGTNHGIEIETWSDLPVGSGMGTSSILAGCVLAAIWTATATEYTLSDLTHAVLIIEQMLTTGGGWQDQVNGLYPGIKRGRCVKSDTDLRVETEILPAPDEFLERLSSHMLLVFTGKVRLAKNLLRTVITQWYEGSSEIVGAIERNYATAEEMAGAIKREDIEAVGKIFSEFWALKRTLAKGAEPKAITEILDKLRPLCYGQSLAGAGGGGFMVLITKAPNAKTDVEKILAGTNCTCHVVEISSPGLRVRRGEMVVQIR